MTERSSEGLDERRRKLLFRAWRRGVREMDLIVGRFADAHIDKMAKKYLGVDKYPYAKPGEIRVIYKIRPEHTTVMG